MERIEVQEKENPAQLICYHCGDECRDDSIRINEKVFCCNGCKTVYEMLEENNLCDYYSIDQNPGIKKKFDVKRNYDFLDDPDLKQKLIEFSNGILTSVTFSIPQMHCSSCIWILENLNRLDEGIVFSRVNFLEKKISLRFNEKTTSLKNVVSLLDSLGYEPLLNLEDKKEINRRDAKKLYYKIGIAGFGFGNIMLLGFPEYLSINLAEHEELKQICSYLNLLLSLPIFFFSASDYYISAWKGLKKKIVNIDVPIALGIIVLFIRSLAEILFFNQAGYLDSLAGLVFFLLIGKLFQDKTYDTLNFERDYKSYFPISVAAKINNIETTIPVEKLNIGQRIIIRNNEIIPADSVLIKGKGNIDYSFVNGEASPVEIENGQIIYAGGRQIGAAIELDTIKDVSQSYLTRLWNNHAFKKDVNEVPRITFFANAVSKYFTAIVLLIATASAVYWFQYDSVLAFNAFTAVLIVACPCALALSTPFAMGNALRIFGRNKFYLKNSGVIEKLSSINSIVFDKTGTITENYNSEVEIAGDLNEHDKYLIKSAVKNSSHPLSFAVNNFLGDVKTGNTEIFIEETGLGIKAIIDGNEVKVGSKKFVEINHNDLENDSTRVFVSINNIVKGHFKISNKYRNGLENIINDLERNYEIALLSGDNSSEKNKLRTIFGSDKELHFNQSPQMKLDFINELQNKGKHVLMIGDGLNDAGALKQSDVGISISDDINNFSPACDGILESGSFNKIVDFIKFSKTSKKVVIASFILSLVYNVAGLYFAVQGNLSPVIAAILMPLSSITAVAFTTFFTTFFAKAKGLL